MSSGQPHTPVGDASRERQEASVAPWAANELAGSSFGSSSNVTRSPSLALPPPHSAAAVTPSPGAATTPAPLPLSYALAHSPSVERRHAATRASPLGDQVTAASPQSGPVRPAPSSHVSPAPRQVSDDDSPPNTSPRAPTVPAGYATSVSSRERTSPASADTAVHTAEPAAVAVTAAATRAATEVIQRLTDEWVPCVHADLPPRYRNVAGFNCDYCTYTVCEGCLAEVPSALLEPVGSGGAAHTSVGTDTGPVPTLDDSLRAMAHELLTGHTHFTASATATASSSSSWPSSSLSPSALLARSPGGVPCFRCHLCKRGVLVYEEALLHEWSCEGPMPVSRVRRRHSVVYDTTILQRYHFIKEQRQARAQTRQRLTARFHGYYASATDERLQRPPGRPPRCEEGGSFVVSVENPRLAEACVWCAVNHAVRQTSAGYRGVMTVTPVLPWVCPPSLPGVAPRRYRVYVPEGAYAFQNTHALALFTCSDLFRKTAPHLASEWQAQEARAVGGLGGTPTQTPSKKKRGRHSQLRPARTSAFPGSSLSLSPTHGEPAAYTRSGAGVALGTPLALPSGAVEALLTVYVTHHIATQRVPPVTVLTTLCATSSGALPWRVEPCAETAALLHDVDGAACRTHKRPRPVEAEAGMPPPQKTRVEPDDAARLAWPPGLASEELRLCVDHVRQGRSLAVYGLGSKRFFLQHVAHAASLNSYAIITVDGALSAQVRQQQSLKPSSPGHNGGVSAAARRLRDVARHLASHLTAPRELAPRRGATGAGGGLPQRVLDALAGQAAAIQDEEAARGGTGKLAPPPPRCVREARSHSLPRDTTTGTLAAAAAAEALAGGGTPTAAVPASVGVVDVIDVDDETPSGADLTPPPSQVPLAPGVTCPSVGAHGNWRTPQRPTASSRREASRSQSLPPPTQLRQPLRAVHTAGTAADDGVDDLVKELAKALSSPVPCTGPRMVLSPSPRRHVVAAHTDAAAHPLASPPRVDLGTSTSVPSPPAARGSQAVAAPAVGVHEFPAAAVRVPRPTDEGAHADGLPINDQAPSHAATPRTAVRAGLTVDAALRMLAAPVRDASRKEDVDLTTRDALHAASTSYTFDVPCLAGVAECGEQRVGEVHHDTPLTARFAEVADHARYMARVHRMVRGHCTRWHSLPSTTAHAFIGDHRVDDGPDGLVGLREARRVRSRQPPVLLVIHNIDQLDAEAEAWLLHLCRQFAFPRPHVQLLVSFDKPSWPLSPLAKGLEALSLVMLQLRSLMLPRVQEWRDVHALDLLAQFESAASVTGVVASRGAGGGHGQSLPLQDTMRRVLFSLPATFAELLHILLAAQEEHGENRYISLFTLGEYFEKNGLLVSHGRMKALQRELTSNRLAVYDGAEHALYIPQHRKLAKVLEEVTALRQSGGEEKGYADTTR